MPDFCPAQVEKPPYFPASTEHEAGHNLGFWNKKSMCVRTPELAPALAPPASKITAAAKIAWISTFHCLC
jgi:hypothetical protein